jgi:hypothetical protein
VQSKVTPEKKKVGGVFKTQMGAPPLFRFSFAFLNPFHPTLTTTTIIMSSLRLALRPLQSTTALTSRLYSTATPSRLASVSAATSTLPQATSAAALHAGGALRNDWTREEIQAIYDSPFLELMYYGVSAIHLKKVTVTHCFWSIGQNTP